MSKPIKFRALKDIYWDDWGHTRRVFEKGQVYDGVMHSNGNVFLSGTTGRLAIESD